MNLNWKTILKKAGIILLSTLLFALCSGLLYITKMAGSINITRPEDEPELASAMTNENLDTETREKLGGYWTIAVFGVDSRNVHAFIIGEHGDSELAVWSGANVSGISLDHFCELRGYYEHDKADEWLQREVRDSAYEIIRRKGATYYGVAMAVERIVRAIVRDEHSVLPVSNLLQGQYGIDGLCMSIPAVVGRNGVEDTLEIPLSPAEREALRDSAATLRGVVDSLEL